jgi:hypothetical protein
MYRRAFRTIDKLGSPFHVHYDDRWPPARSSRHATNRFAARDRPWHRSRSGCSPNRGVCPCRAAAGAVACSMIAGRSPRYSRVTTRDHDVTAHRIPPVGMERGTGSLGCATPIVRKHQATENRNKAEPTGVPARDVRIWERERGRIRPVTRPRRSTCCDSRRIAWLPIQDLCAGAGARPIWANCRRLQRGYGGKVVTVRGKVAKVRGAGRDGIASAGSKGTGTKRRITEQGMHRFAARFQGRLEQLAVRRQATHRRRRGGRADGECLADGLQFG